MDGSDADRGIVFLVRHVLAPVPGGGVTSIAAGWREADFFNTVSPAVTVKPPRVRHVRRDLSHWSVFRLTGTNCPVG
jgi:hypothetical protein